MQIRKLTTTRAVLGAVAAAALIAGNDAHAAVTGQWDFNTGTLGATLGGTALWYLDYAGGPTELQTEFLTMDIGGQPAKVMKAPPCIYTMGYGMPTPADPNGGGAYVNQWTLIMDIMYPTESDRKWRTFIETDLWSVDVDAELFVNTSNGIGISQIYNGQILPNVWHRVAFVIDQSEGVNQIRKYIDGNEVGVQAAGGPDGRWALVPYSEAWLFTDNDSDVAVGYINSIQLHDTALTRGQILALAGATAAGIPQDLPQIPSFVENRVPAKDAVNASPKPAIQAVLNAGSTTVTPASIKLSLDGVEKAATVTPSGNTFNVSYTPPALFEPLSVHTLRLAWTDSLAGAKSDEWSFTVADYKEVELSAPLVFENFDAVAEGELPSGWVATNLTDNPTGTIDFTNPNSDAYLDFVVISSNTVAQVFNANRRNMMPVVVNGEPLSSLISGNFAYAESDTRSGTQVQVLISPDFNLTGKTDIYLSFHSIYTQNQDSLGAVEYSIDQGQTWLPALYMLAVPDVIRDTEGNVDAVATFETVRGDQAHGLAYGAYIGATVSPALAPFVSARIDDDQFESKRVEVLRLAQADNQPKVRLRFMQTGTGSWYFGIDDVGLYSMPAFPPTIVTQPLSQHVSVGAALTLEVAAQGKEPITYQWKFNGQNIAGATAASYTIASVQTANAGEYTAVASNNGGSVQSSKAIIEVFAGAITENLVAHLKFEDAFTDSSGRGNNGTVGGGAPSFVDGLVGKALHLGSTEDYVTLGTPVDLDFGIDTDFSIAFWTRLNVFTDDPSFIGNKDWDSGGNQGYVLSTDDDRHFQWNLAGAPGGRKDYDGPPDVLTETEWHHITVTFDRTGYAATYIDGTWRNSTSLAGSQNDVNTPSGMATNIGQDGAGDYGPRFSDTDIDDLGVWRRVLTPQEIAAVVDAGKAGKDLSTVAIVPPPELKLAPPTVANSQVTLTWNGAADVKLQKTTSLSPSNWQDVAGTQGKSSHTEPVAGSAAFYRLAK